MYTIENVIMSHQVHA